MYQRISTNPKNKNHKKKKITPSHIIIKLLTASDKEKILTPVRERRYILRNKDKDERFLTGINTS